MSLVLGVMGAKGAGKDTFASYLRRGLEVRGTITEHLAFADPIREMMAALNPYVYNGENFERYNALLARVGYTAAKEVSEVRRLLQTLGTEAGRDILGSDLWVDVLFRKAHESLADIVIVTDVRFKNEFNRIKRDDGLVFQVSCRAADALSDPHASENEWRDLEPDFIVDNDTSLVDLSTLANKYAEFLRVHLIAHGS